jgi:opacity protein-like surface antigen
MKTYKRILLTSALFTVTSGAALAGGIVLEDEYTRYTKPVIEEEEEIVLEIEIEVEEEATPYWEILGMGGFGAFDAGDSTLDITGSEVDKLVQTNENDWETWTAQLGVGYVIPLFDAEEYSDEIQWFPAIEPQLNVYYLEGDIVGDVYRFESPDFNEADYSINLKSTRLMFDVALTLASWRDLSVFALAGIGPSWNRLDFSSHIDEGVDCDLNDVGVDSHTDTNFAYEFGGGVTYELTEHLALSAEYLFTGFDDLKLGNSDDVEDLDPSDFHLNSSAFLFGLRVMF